jgi:hypothetical protein
MAGDERMRESVCVCVCAQGTGVEESWIRALCREPGDALGFIPLLLCLPQGPVLNMPSLGSSPVQQQQEEQRQQQQQVASTSEQHPQQQHSQRQQQHQQSSPPERQSGRQQQRARDRERELRDEKAAQKGARALSQMVSRHAQVRPWAILSSGKSSSLRPRELHKVCLF